jgi:maltodextrin utilization protein YvdJ
MEKTYIILCSFAMCIVPQSKFFSMQNFSETLQFLCTSSSLLNLKHFLIYFIIFVWLRSYLEMYYLMPKLMGSC